MIFLSNSNNKNMKKTSQMMIFFMNINEFKYRFLNNYKELEQLSISSMIPGL